MTKRTRYYIGWRTDKRSENYLFQAGSVADLREYNRNWARRKKLPVPQWKYVEVSKKDWLKEKRRLERAGVIFKP